MMHIALSIAILTRDAQGIGQLTNEINCALADAGEDTPIWTGSCIAPDGGGILPDDLLSISALTPRRTWVKWPVASVYPGSLKLY